MENFTESEGGIFLVGTDEGEFLDGGAGNDSLEGGLGDDALFGFGGRDTLVGGLGSDEYFINFETGGGSEIFDIGGELDDFILVARNTDLQILADNYDSDSYLNLRANSGIYGDSAIELSFPTRGIVGLEKLGNNLIIDLDRDGVVQPANDLTIFNFFDESGEAGTGKVERINNIIDTSGIVDFFANSAREQLKDEDFGEHTIYRFYDANSGVHFYTSDKNERNYVYDRLNNYTYEGASYTGIDPTTEIESLAVYRFYNRDSGTHLYTTDENEKNTVRQELDNYNYEGEAFFAYNFQVEGSIPIYRFFNSTTGAHFYTPSAIERDAVIKELPNFQSEGIAYYALPIVSGEI